MSLTFFAQGALAMYLSPGASSITCALTWKGRVGERPGERRRESLEREARARGGGGGAGARGRGEREQRGGRSGKGRVGGRRGGGDGRRRGRGGSGAGGAVGRGGAVARACSGSLLLLVVGGELGCGLLRGGSGPPPRPPSDREERDQSAHASFALGRIRARQQNQRHAAEGRRAQVGLRPPTCGPRAPPDYNESIDPPANHLAPRPGAARQKKKRDK
ncbi:unnamed protein product [Boreogadus saida]